jgi:hypothetical protein
VTAADLLRCEQAVVALVRGHPEVHDGDVGPPGFDHAQQDVGVAAAAGDLEAGVLEEPARPSRSSASSSAITTRTASPGAALRPRPPRYWWS